MIKSKTFAKVTMVVAWANSNPANRLVGCFRDATGFSILYEQPETADDERERLAILQKRLRKHFDYPVSTKTSMGYPVGIRPFRVVPMTRLVNSIRNLLLFKGMPLPELTAWVEKSLPVAGCKILTRSEAKGEYGHDVTLIEEL